MITDVVMNNKNTAAWLCNDCHAAAIFKNSSLNVRQVKVSLLPAHNHELAQIQLGLFQIFML
jgi:hypothetical protein